MKMKSFKHLVEAMGGKRVFNFTGVDEIGDFWVVLNSPRTGVEIFAVDAIDLILQKDGGLKIDEIVGLYKNRTNAKKAAAKLGI